MRSRRWALLLHGTKAFALQALGFFLHTLIPQKQDLLFLQELQLLGVNLRLQGYIVDAPAT